MKETIIKALMIEPLKQPKETLILNDLKYINRLINQDPDYTENLGILELEENVIILHNKNGALFDLIGNRRVKNEIIAGTFFIMGINEKGYAVSLPDDKITKYKKRFWREEFYTEKEVMNSYWNKFEKDINALEKLFD